MMTFKQFLAFLKSRTGPPFLDEIIATENGSEARLLREGKWYNGRFESSIRIDNPTHGAGQRHAHLFGRKGQELGAVNIDGTASHGSKMRIHDEDSEELRAMGFTIPKDGIVEWISVPDGPRLLLG